jgi:nucleolar MIF4G domain-containing protein 1
VIDLLSFADKVARGSSSSKGKSQQTASAFESEDDAAMDGFSDLEDEDMMSLGSEDEDSEMDEDQDSFGDEEELSDDLAEEDDDLASFFTDDEGDDNESDEELRRNTERNARTANMDIEPVPEPVPSPVAVPAPPTGKYIPPSLRKLQQAIAAPSEAGPPSSSSTLKSPEGQQKSEQQVRLERKIQGLLNKLSEANIVSILGDVEALYRESSRNGKHSVGQRSSYHQLRPSMDMPCHAEVTTTLTDMVIRTISDRANLLDSFVILYASFVAALYKIKGADFGK